MGLSVPLLGKNYLKNEWLFKLSCFLERRERILPWYQDGFGEPYMAMVKSHFNDPEFITSFKKVNS